MHKLGSGQGDLQQPVRYPNFWSVEPTTGPDRLVIAPAGDQVDVMRALCEEWPGDYFLLYVLLVPRLGTREPGRYQSPAPLSFERISEFCDRFRAFLQTDGRHHFWIGSCMESGLLVYDHHDVIYAYGDLDHDALLKTIYEKCPAYANKSRLRRKPARKAKPRRAGK